MKKNILIILSIFVVILLIITTIFIVQLKSMKNIKGTHDKEMEFFLQFENKKFDVDDFISIMNKAIDNNERHNVKLNKENEYEEDGKYSIKVFLRLDDKEKLIPMEYLMFSENGGSRNIERMFSDISYKYEEIKYYENSTRIKEIIIYGFTKGIGGEFNLY